MTNVYRLLVKISWYTIREDEWLLDWNSQYIRFVYRGFLGVTIPVLVVYTPKRYIVESNYRRNGSSIYNLDATD